MPIVTIGGSHRKVGKTSLACGVIAAFAELPWTAIKITTHNHGKPELVWEETHAGQGTDTARYLAAGAHRALLVTAGSSDLPAAEIRAALGTDPYVIVESNRAHQILELNMPAIHLVVVGASETHDKQSFQLALQNADAFVCSAQLEWAPSGDWEPTRDHRPAFVVPDLGRISPELRDWMRTRLGLPIAAR
jgi:molybdopterin-guanine dinucleotide biosynthesis protein